MTTRSALTRIVAGFAIVGAMAAHAADQAVVCEPVIAKDVTGPREVFLAGGDAWQLFQRYQDTLKKEQNSALDLAKVQVHLKTKGAAKDFARGGFWGMFGGTSKEQWEGDLSEVFADLDPASLADARQKGWDIFCPRTAPPLPPPASPSPSGASKAADGGTVPSVVGFKAGMIYAAQHDYRNAIREFGAVEVTDPAYPKLQMNMGVEYLLLKDYVQAIQHLTKALDQDKAAGKVDPDTHYNMACVQARLGQKDDAIRSLETALANGFQHGDRIAQDGDLASLRNDPRFQKLVKRASPPR